VTPPSQIQQSKVEARPKQSQVAFEGTGCGASGNRNAPARAGPRAVAIVFEPINSTRLVVADCGGGRYHVAHLDAPEGTEIAEAQIGIDATLRRNLVARH
jgi:hypothetical protein